MNVPDTLSCRECENYSATWFCHDCRLTFCDDCSIHHKRCARNKGHNVQRLESKEALVERMVCQKHKKRLKYVCLTCKSSTCTDCTLNKVHRDHTFKLIDDIIQEESEELEKLIPTARAKGARYEAHVKRAEEFLKMASERKRTSCKVVTQTLDALINLLEMEKINILQWLNGAYDASVESFNSACDELKVANATTEYLHQILRYPREEVSDIIIEGNRHLKEFIANMNEVFDDRKCVDPENIFHITASFREVRSSELLETIKSVLNQICTLNDVASNQGKRILGLKSDCSNCCGNGCRSSYPSAFISSEVHFNKNS